mgnify:CR=1 FL=1
MTIDPVNLTADLIRCESVTPKEAGALVLLEELLAKAGFECNRVDRGLVSNLFARWGTGKTLGFNGHTDVVPIGSLDDWSVCLLYTSPSPRDATLSRMPSSA